MKIKCDYDWLNPVVQSHKVTGRIIIDKGEVIYDEEVESLICLKDISISYEFSRNGELFIPTSINGKEVIYNRGGIINGQKVSENLSYVASACIAHLRSHPYTRKFEMEGDIR